MGSLEIKKVKNLIKGVNGDYILIGIRVLVDFWGSDSIDQIVDLQSK